MNNNLQSIIGNLEKGDKLELGNNEIFSNDIILNQSVQCSVLEGINFVNLTFNNIDFTGSFFFLRLFLKIVDLVMWYWENPNFGVVPFLECQIKESNLTRAEFNSSIFKNCEFLQSDLAASDFWNCEFSETTFKHSNLNFIIVQDVKVWKSKEWIEVNDFSILEKEF